MAGVVITVVLIVVSHLSCTVTQNTDVITECTFANLDTCLAPIKQYRSDLLSVFWDLSQTLDFCLCFDLKSNLCCCCLVLMIQVTFHCINVQLTIRCTHELVAICPNTTNVRGYEYYLYYALCPESKLNDFEMHYDCFRTSATIRNESQRCLEDFFLLSEQRPQDACQHSQNLGRCVHNTTLQECGPDAAEWMIATLAYFLTPSIDVECPIVRPTPYVLSNVRTANGVAVPCQFPFFYNGRQYSQCIVFGAGEPNHWCSITDGVMTDVEPAMCIFPTTGGNSGGANCKFPFLYNGAIYNQCIVRTTLSDKPFCATTNNWDLDGLWGNCPRFDCTSRLCLNGGWCSYNNYVEVNVCVCTEQWTGPQCDIAVDACEQSNIDFCLDNLRENSLVANLSLSTHTLYNITDVVDICSRYWEAKQCLKGVTPACTYYVASQIAYIIVIYDHICTNLVEGYLSHQQCLQEVIADPCDTYIVSISSLHIGRCIADNEIVYQELCSLVDEFLICQGNTLLPFPACSDDPAIQWQLELSIRIISSQWSLASVCPAFDYFGGVDGRYVYNYCHSVVPEACELCTGSTVQCPTDLHHNCLAQREYETELLCVYGEDSLYFICEAPSNLLHCESVAQQAAGLPFELSNVYDSGQRFFASYYGCQYRQILAHCGVLAAHAWVPLAILQDTAAGAWDRDQYIWLADGSQCTANNVDVCLKDGVLSSLDWYPTIAPVYDENEIRAICRAYLVAEDCLKCLESDCTLLIRLKLLALQVVPNYICTNLTKGYLVHTECFNNISLAEESIKCSERYQSLRDANDHPDVTDYYNEACILSQEYLLCMSTAMESAPSCNQNAIAWQIELSQRSLWVDYGMPNTPCWGVDLSALTGFNDTLDLIFDTFEIRLSCPQGVFETEYYFNQYDLYSNWSDYCSLLEANQIIAVDPSCNRFYTFYHDSSCFEVPITITYELHLDYSDGYANTTSPERQELDTLQCNAWMAALSRLNYTLTLRGCTLIDVHGGQSTQVTVKLYLEYVYINAYLTYESLCSVLSTYSDEFNYTIGGNCVVSSYRNYSCDIAMLSTTFELSMARSLQIATSLNPTVFQSDECRFCDQFLSTVWLAGQRICHVEALLVSYHNVFRAYINVLLDISSCPNAATDDCYSKPCLHGGTCVLNPDHGYTCSCTQHYTGVTCETATNDCVSEPCMHGGICFRNADHGYNCSCSQHYTGVTCEKDVDECMTLSPCLNGGTCNNTMGSYECSCTPEWSGPTCDQDVNECVSNAPPCANGATCNNSAGSYECICPPNWNGTHCDEDVDECMTLSPCLNGGTCYNTMGSYECSCTPEWSGPTCDQATDDCYSVPCLHGGTCVLNPDHGYNCSCSQNYTGLSCEKGFDVCYSEPCLHGGTCVLYFDHVYTCSCTQKYTGPSCESVSDPCSSGPCLNRGTCVHIVFPTSGYKCLCTSGYSGSACESDTLFCEVGYEYVGESHSCTTCAHGFYNDDFGQLPCTPCPLGTTTTGTGATSAADCELENTDACVSNPCGPYGACMDTDGSFLCTCDSGFYGDTCDNHDYAYETSINLGNTVANFEFQVKETVKRNNQQQVRTRQIKWKKVVPIV